MPRTTRRPPPAGCRCSRRRQRSVCRRPRGWRRTCRSSAGTTARRPANDGAPTRPRRARSTAVPWVAPLLARSGLHTLHGHGDRAATAESQRREPIATFAPLELVEERRDDARAARPDRVAERDRAAVDVDLVPIEAELPAVCECL